VSARLLAALLLVVALPAWADLIVETEPNDAYYQANPTKGAGQLDIDGVISSVGDHDFFSFTVADVGQFQSPYDSAIAMTISTPGSSGVLICFEVLNPRGDAMLGGCSSSPATFPLYPAIQGGRGLYLLLMDRPDAIGPYHVSFVATAQSGAVAPTLLGTVPTLVAAASLKPFTYGLQLSLDPANPTIEPRRGPGHRMHFQFDMPISAASATVTEGVATVSAIAFGFNGVDVDLADVSDQQYVTVALTNMISPQSATAGSAALRVGFLAGDVNQDRVVTVADLALVNAELAKPVNLGNFLADVNASGSISIADKAITNANLTKALPP
jgi:hypothetical protein